MTSPEKIRQRVEEADTARSARRAAAAQQVGDLAQRRLGIVEQLEEVERELGAVLAEAQDVIGTDELATFTDVKVADLTRWLANHKANRARRKRTAGRQATRDEARTSGRSVPDARQDTPPQEPADGTGSS